MSSFSSHSQYRRNRFYRKHRLQHNSNIDWAGTLGVAMGGENLLSVPKLSGYGSLPFGKRRKSHRNFSRNAFYFGSEVSLLVFFGGAFSIAAVTGIKAGPITLDCNINRMILSNPNGDIVGRQSTINPKFGCMLGPVWLKVGPSFLLTDTPIWTDITGGFMQIKDTPLNIEVVFDMTWSKY